MRYRRTGVECNVDKISKGFRILLQYSLINKDQAKAAEPYAKFDPQRLRHGFDVWKALYRSCVLPPQRMAYILENSGDELLPKGQDRARVKILQEIGGAYGLQLYYAYLEKNSEIYTQLRVTLYDLDGSVIVEDVDANFVGEYVAQSDLLVDKACVMVSVACRGRIPADQIPPSTGSHSPAKERKEQASIRTT
jgi:hypothetical protein